MIQKHYILLLNLGNAIKFIFIFILKTRPQPAVVVVTLYRKLNYFDSGTERFKSGSYIKSFMFQFLPQE